MKLMKSTSIQGRLQGVLAGVLALGVLAAALPGYSQTNKLPISKSGKIAKSVSTEAEVIPVQTKPNYLYDNTVEAPFQGPLVKPKLVAQSSEAVFAPSTTATLSTKIEQSEAKPADKAWGLEANLEQSGNMVKQDDPTAKYVMDLTLLPSYKFTDRLSGSVKSVIEKAENGPGDTTVSDTTLALTYQTVKFSDELVLSNTLKGIAPTSKDSNDVQKLHGAVGFTTAITATIPLGTYAYALGYSHNFHEFNVDRTGTENVSQAIKHEITTETPLFGSKFYFASDLVYRNAWTYFDHLQDKFSFEFDLEYKATDAFTAYIGTSNEGDAVQANGSDSNVKFYNDRTQVFKAGLTYDL